MHLSQLTLYFIPHLVKLHITHHSSRVTFLNSYFTYGYVALTHISHMLRFFTFAHNISFKMCLKRIIWAPDISC